MGALAIEEDSQWGTPAIERRTVNGDTSYREDSQWGTPTIEDMERD